MVTHRSWTKAASIFGSAGIQAGASRRGPTPRDPEETGRERPIARHFALARALQKLGPELRGAQTMTLRCTFHVSNVSVRTPSQETRQRMPSVLDLDIEYIDEPLPRGTSAETWRRARGWSSED
jgi:hypothetical protein